MKDEVQQLLAQLDDLLPMPDDELASPELLKRYYNIIRQLALHKDLSPNCIEPLLASFGYFDGYGVYWETLHLLERFGPILEPYLLEALQHENKGTRLWTTTMLIHGRSKSAIPGLIALLNDEAEHVKSAAANALGAIGGAAMRPYLERLRNDPSIGDSVQHVLTNWMDEEIDAPHFFISGLTADSPGTRAWAARRLKRNRNKAAIPELIALLDDESEYAKAHAAEVLSVLGGRAMLPHIEKLRDDPSAETRSVVKRILDAWERDAADASTEVDSLLEELRALLPMPDDTRVSNELLARYANIVEQLAGHEEQRRIEPLLESFGYGDGAGVYWRTVSLLETFDADELFPYLLEALRHGNRGTRLWAARMLKRSGSTEAILNLIGLLDDEAEYVRAEAVSALGVLGGPVMQLSIESLLDDPSVAVRAAVNQILDGWKDEVSESP